MHKIGMDAHLLIDRAQSIFTVPWWEEININATNEYDPKILSHDNWSMPDWIHLVKYSNGAISRTADIYYLLKGYDILQGWAPSAIYLQFQRTPYIMYECGWMRKFPFMNDNSCKLARRGYMKAKAIIMTNPDMYYTTEHMAYLPPTKFIPFAIPYDHYTFKPVNDGKQLIFINPARCEFRIKGTDKLIMAWHQYICKTSITPLPKLYIVKWGTDLKKTMELVNSLPQYSRATIKFFDLLSKPELIKALHNADVVCDQFVLGSYGTTAPESMACGRPVLMYLNRHYNTMAYGAVPPIANAYTVNEIAEQMLALEDIEYRKQLSLAGRKWIIKNHDPVNVAYSHKKLYEEVLQ
jgi:glycosyltransferase involved in cell wall biosynthesis